MLRQNSPKSTTWFSKTMSQMQEAQFRDCEDRLMKAPEISLFSDQFTDQMAEERWSYSLYAEEYPDEQLLHTVDQMRSMVMDSLACEVCYLSVHEHRLLEQTLISRGKMVLNTREEFLAAETLTRRLWCTIERKKDGFSLNIPPQIIFWLMMAVQKDETTESLNSMAMTMRFIRDMLYLFGRIPADAVMEKLTSITKEGTEDDRHRLSWRLLTAYFDYQYDTDGSIILLHPGLAEPERIAVYGWTPPGDTLPVDGMKNILPEEQDISGRMARYLTPFLRPDCDPNRSVRDLRLLIKQHVGRRELQGVLAAMLVGLPDDTMLALLDQLIDFTPRWGTLQMGRLQ